MNVDLDVAVTVPAPGPTDTFLDDPARWLPAPALHRGPAAWIVNLDAGALHREVRLELGQARLMLNGLRRPVRWKPADDQHLIPLEAFLPSFTGELRLVHVRANEAELRLVGSYRPPGGLAGGLLDRTALHRVAEATARHFLEAVAQKLCQPREVLPPPVPSMV